MALSIPTDKQAQQFRKHLHEKGNDRIIFSGPFGVGKTYFLQEFFDKTYTDYLTITLTPVNYSLSSNEDIFKLIKYDILVEAIIRHGLLLDFGKTVNRNAAYSAFLPSKIEPIITALLPILPLLNKSAEDIPVLATALLGLMQVWKDVEKQRMGAGAPAKPAVFGEEMINHFLLESDEATSYLEESLAILANQRNSKYKVLIIDDLDRIDPEHIFRLFNIFSAHLDYNKSLKNKFGFDRVIFVCDINNIRNIFHSRYGGDTDFTGYIDKFFSQEVFYFNNEEEILSIVKDFVKSIKPAVEGEQFINENILSGRNYREKSTLEVILTELILSGTLRMRRVINMHNITFALTDTRLNAGSSHRQAGVWQLPMLGTIQLLVKILGGGTVLEKALRVVDNSIKSMDYRETSAEKKSWLSGSVLPILGYQTHKFKASHSNSNAQYPYNLDNKGLMLYKLIEVGNRHEIFFADIDTQGAYDFFTLLHQTVKLLLRDGIIK